LFKISQHVFFPFFPCACVGVVKGANCFSCFNRVFSFFFFFACLCWYCERS